MLNVLGIIFMFLYSGLQNDQINIIQAFITADGGGWNATMTQMPMTVGNFLCIILTFLYGTLFIKFGVKKPLIVVMIITAVATMGIVAANGLDCNGGADSGNYPLFFISLLIVRCGCMILQMAGLCWWLTGSSLPWTDHGYCNHGLPHFLCSGNFCYVYPDPE